MGILCYKDAGVDGGDPGGGGGGGNTPTLSIFDTFKTKADQLTGEAIRQRAILSILAAGDNSSPSGRTRTAIAQIIAKKKGVPWKNIYSGVFRDFDEILIPLRLVREEGRLPLKRGPKALQEKGIPYYALTRDGMVAAASLFDPAAGMEEGASALDRVLEGIKEGGGYGSDGDGGMNMLAELGGVLPRFTFFVFERYVRGYCRGEITELVPVSMDKMTAVMAGGSLEIYRELLDGLSGMGKDKRRAFSEFLDSVSSPNDAVPG